MTSIEHTGRVILFLALAAFVPACGSTVTPSDGATDAGTDVRSHEDQLTPTDTPPRTPLNHRAVANACPTTRGAGSCPYPDAGVSTACGSDSECSMGTNGRCLQEIRSPSCTCSYDQCASDSDCAAGGVCACRLSSRSARGANVCLAANCHTDSDCGPQGFCSPSLDFSCGAYTGVTGYYCHTPQDECTDDSDCVGRDAGIFGGAPFCGYSRTAGHWACSSSQCVG